MKPSDRGSAEQVVYDMGNGGRLLSGIVFAAMVIAPVAYLIARRDEFRELPGLVLRDPMAGAVLLLGGGLVAWCVGLGVWIPFRSFLFPQKVRGVFAGFSIVRDARKRPRIEIEVANTQIRARFNPLLSEALASLSAGDSIEVVSGAGGFITHIKRI